MTELSDILSMVAIAISLGSLYFTWKTVKKQQPLFRHEVLSCKHKVAKNGKSTNLQIVFRLHNEGDRGTKLLNIEAYATDFKGVEHSSSVDFSRYLDAHNSTEKTEAFFYFSPFQYTKTMSCRFIIHHTTDVYSFKHESEESEDYLESVYVKMI